jgi:uncharacterized protein YjbJ (UPF0337 family)
MCDSIQTRPVHVAKLEIGTKKEFDMNRDTVLGNWKQFKGKAKVKWGKFIGNHVEEIEGKGVEVSGKIQKGYGVAKDATEQHIGQFDERTNK